MNSPHYILVESNFNFRYVQERLINWWYGIDMRWYWYYHKIWHLIACEISVSSSILNFHYYFFYCISELMLKTLIQRYNKKIIIIIKIFHFWSSSRTREELNYCSRLSESTFYDCIITIYQFIKPFLDNKISIFEEYGAFKELSEVVPRFMTSMLYPFRL